MSKTRSIATVCGLALLIVLAFVLFAPANPTYHGRRLSQWFTLSMASLDGHRRANEAFRAVGPRAVPFLRRKLQYQPSWRDKIAVRYAKYLSSPLQKHLQAGPAREYVVKNAVSLLGEIGTPAQSAVPDLLSLLKEELATRSIQTAVMQRAVLSGGQFRGLPPGLLPPWNQVRWQLITSLAKIGSDDPRVILTLLKATATQDGSGDATQALASFAFKPAVRKCIPYLVESLNSETSVRMGALLSLATVLDENPELVPRFVAFLDDPSPQVRAQAAACLFCAHSGYEMFVPKLIEMLPVESMRTAAMTPTYQPSMVIGFATNNYNLTSPGAAAAGTLAELSLRSPFVISSLTHALDDPQIRAKAAGVLGEIGPRAAEAVPALRLVGADSDRNARYAAAWALWNIAREHEALLPFRIEELKSGNEMTRWAASDFLADLGVKGIPAIPALVDTLDHPSWRTRAHIAKCLGRFGPDAASAAPALEAKSQDEWYAVRDEAAAALKKIVPAGSRR